MSSRSWKVERRETQFCVKTTLPHINLNTSHRQSLSLDYIDLTESLCWRGPSHA